MFRKLVAVLIMIFMGLTSCTYKSASTYKPNETGTVMEVKRVTIISSRKVIIEGLKENQTVGWGTAVGATVAGAAAYGLTEADTPLGVAVTIIAAVGGALAGTIIEEQKNRHPGAEYILQGKGEKPFAVVQALGDDDKILRPGRRAVVLYGRGNFVRVVPEN